MALSSKLRGRSPQKDEIDARRDAQRMRIVFLNLISQGDHPFDSSMRGIARMILSLES